MPAPLLAAALTLVVFPATSEGQQGRPRLAGEAADASPRSAKKERVPLADWYRGPVRYLLRRSEEKEFRSLRNDAARALFIRDFWRSRDPDPRTQENEARLAFWQRVADANHLFNESARPGWMTDRGRIHILLGAPNDTQEDLNFQVPGRPLGGRGLLRWIYHGKVLTGRHEPTFVVAFVVDESGEWRLTDDAVLSSVTFDPLSAKALQETSPLLARLESALADSVTDLGAALDLGRMTTPADETPLIDTVSSETFYGAIPLSARWDFYPGAGDGRTLAVVTVFVKRAELASPASGADPRPLILGKLEGATGERVDLGEGSFSPAEENTGLSPERILLFQARTLARPGTYRAYVGLFDTISYHAGSHKATLEVPDLSTGRLAISPITPLSALRPVTRRADVGYTLPFILGDLRVLPRDRAAFPRSEGLMLYFQFTVPPAQKASRLEMRFFRREGESLVPAGSPQITDDPSPVQGWSFPLAGWPAGTYRLVVTLTGQEDSQTATQHLDFEVTAE